MRTLHSFRLARLALARGLAIALASAALVLASMTSDATANDFPTIERVMFVEACAREHPDRPHQEMLYKCSCALDALAADYTYDQYVDLSTAFDAGQIAGERGAAVRESTTGQDLIKQFRAARSKAFSGCFIQ
jgi:hypothetical protein